MLEADKQRLIAPYYMRMMSTNVVGEGDDLATEVAALAQTLSVADVVELLRSEWRPRVMGAWFGGARTEIAVGDEVLASLDTCFGSLTSPPLVVAALLHRRPTTAERLIRYVERDRANGWGSAGFALAAVEYLRGPAEDGLLSTDADRRTLAAMLEFGSRLRGE